MRNQNLIIEKIENFGEIYCKKYLFGCWNKETLKNNWWEALRFFFSHSFMRGRRDKLSNEYYYFTIDVLKDYFSISDSEIDSSYKRLMNQREHFNKECILRFKKYKKIGRGNSIKHNDFKKELAEKNPIVKLLITPKVVKVKWENEAYHKKIHLGNDADVMMVMDVLSFITSDDNWKNIYNYLKNNLENSRIKTVYQELIGPRFRSISDKIATFIIRDVLLLNPEIKIREEDYNLAFPIDVWVRKNARILGCNSKDIEKMKICLIDKCKFYKKNLLKFAVGLWYAGFHSIDILENCIGEIKN